MFLHIKKCIRLIVYIHFVFTFLRFFGRSQSFSYILKKIIFTVKVMSHLCVECTITLCDWIYRLYLTEGSSTEKSKLIPLSSHTRPVSHPLVLSKLLLVLLQTFSSFDQLTWRNTINIFISRFSQLSARRARQIVDDENYVLMRHILFRINYIV